MANQEHVDILKQGVDVWNKWRTENDGRIDLSGINITEYFSLDKDGYFPLQKINLSRADLNEANLSRADLRGANLDNATFHEADLSGANLSNNYISYVHFIDANLSEANLSKARISGNSNFQGSNLQKADLSEASIRNALLIDVDLTYANLSNIEMGQAVAIKNADLSFSNLSGSRIIVSNLSESKFNKVNLSNAQILMTDLRKVMIRDANLKGINFTESDLTGATFVDSDLRDADLTRANLTKVYLIRSNLSGANLTDANLTNTNLTDSDLSNANLTRASLVETCLEGSILDSCKVYGISAWNLFGNTSTEKDLIITHESEAVLTVDNLKVAQFIYMILNNQVIRDVINTVAQKGVLILGRFKKERKEVLDSLKDNLRSKGYLPMLFDFEPSEKRNLTETIQLLANMSKFIIADLTEAKSIPQELSHIIPNFPSVPVVPILLESESEYAMFEHWNGFNSVLKPISVYKSSIHLIENIDDFILDPVNAWLLKKENDNALVKKNKALEEELKALKLKYKGLDNQTSD